MQNCIQFGLRSTQLLAQTTIKKVMAAMTINTREVRRLMAQFTLTWKLFVEVYLNTRAQVGRFRYRS